MAPGTERVRGAYRVVKTLYSLALLSMLCSSLSPAVDQLTAEPFKLAKMDDEDDISNVTKHPLSTVLSDTANALSDVLESAKQHVKQGKIMFKKNSLIRFLFEHDEFGSLVLALNHSLIKNYETGIAM